MPLALQILRALLRVEVEYVHSTLCQPTGEIMTAVGESNITAPLQILESVEFFDRVAQHIHHDNFISISDNDVETRGMESNGVHFFSHLSLHLDF